MIKFKVALGEVPHDHELMTSPAVEPALTDANAGGRFLLVPASSGLWEAPETVGGWVCKVKKVNRLTKITEVQFKDGKVDFETKDALKFKPIS